MVGAGGCCRRGAAASYCGGSRRRAPSGSAHPEAMAAPPSALCARLTAGRAVGAVTDTSVGATGYGEGTA